MDSFVKCGNGYGSGYGYGYGNSKPQMNYHSQNSESVTTVVTEINRMTVNDDKPCYGGSGDVQKQACKVEAFQEHDEAYNGAVAVQQKHSFKQEKQEEKYGAAAAAAMKHDEYKEKYGEVVDAGSYGAHYGGGGAAVKNKQGYNYAKQEAYGETLQAAAGYGGGAHYGGGGGVKKQQAGYNNYTQEACRESEAAGYGGGAHYGGTGAGGKKQAGYSYTQEACGESGGYGAHHGGAGAAVQTYAYDEQAMCGGAIGAAVQQPQAYKHKDAATTKTNGSQSQHKVYGYGETAVDAAGAGYGAHYGCGAVQQHGYHQNDAYGYGAATAAAGGKVKKNGYQYHQEAYGGADAGGYGAHYGGAGGGAVQQYGYQNDAYGYGGSTAGGKVTKTGGYQYQEAYGGTGGYGVHYGGGAAGAAVQKHGYMQQDVYESETESESDDSDCEAAFPPRGGRMQGGVQHSYGAYKQEKHGVGNLGGVRRYETFESREDLGGGRRYESYQSTVQYTGTGGGVGYATCSPKNRHLLRYGA